MKLTFYCKWYRPKGAQKSSKGPKKPKRAPHRNPIKPTLREEQFKRRKNLTFMLERRFELIFLRCKTFDAFSSFLRNSIFFSRCWFFERDKKLLRSPPLLDSRRAEAKLKMKLFCSSVSSWSLKSFVVVGNVVVVVAASCRRALKKLLQPSPTLNVASERLLPSTTSLTSMAAASASPTLNSI